MCLIITLLFLTLAIQALIAKDFTSGSLYLVIALAFGFMLWRNIKITYCERNGGCESGCGLPSWLTRWFKRS